MSVLSWIGDHPILTCVLLILLFEGLARTVKALKAVRSEDAEEDD